MRTIAILNLKGGVGKTVTAATMARVLAADYGKTVQLIDADYQGHLSQYFDVEADDRNSTLTLMMQGARYYPDFITPTSEPGISIIPADISLAYADMERVNVLSMRDLQETMEEDQAADYMIIDCPPRFSNSTQAALLAADEVIIPMQFDMFSVTGMADLIHQVDKAREINPFLRVAGVLGTQFRRTPDEIRICEDLQLKSGLPVFRTVIRFSRMVSISVNRHESILTFSPGSAAARDYRKFVREYLEGVSKV